MANRIPLLCRCGNAMMVDRDGTVPRAAMRLEHTACPLCDDGDRHKELAIVCDGTMVFLEDRPDEP